jgi:hypothetical protein
MNKYPNVSDKLVEWIKSKEAEGYSSQQMYQYFVQQGYRPEEIAAAVNTASQTKHDSPNQAKKEILVPAPNLEADENREPPPGRNIVIWIVLVIIIAIVLGVTFYIYDNNIEIFKAASFIKNRNPANGTIENFTGYDSSGDLSTSEQGTTSAQNQQDTGSKNNDSLFLD